VNHDPNRLDIIMWLILAAHVGDWLDIGQAKESSLRPNKDLLYTGHADSPQRGYRPDLDLLSR
jgi:hypothetical protein